MKVFYSKQCEQYSGDKNPETPNRIKKTYRFLRDKFQFMPVVEATEREIAYTHTRGLMNAVRHRKFFIHDTPAYPGIFKFSKLAAGAAIQAMQTALGNENAFSLMRPPGHHAGKAFLGGFCYFNNIAIAVNLAIKSMDRVAIIDIDGHHGNGTQDIFLNREEVLYVSLHQKNAYPLSGFIKEDNCHNYPLRPAIKPREYLDILEKALDGVRYFDPDIIAISAGFDAHKKDPLLELELNTKTYYEIARMIRDIERPCFGVLEGGYSDALPQCVYQFLQGLQD